MDTLDINEDEKELTNSVQQNDVQPELDMELAELDFPTPSFNDLPSILPGPAPVTNEVHAERQAKLKQALIVQMEMQKHLHHQLEVCHSLFLWNQAFDIAIVSL